ncbi:hypothetical protein GALL_554770 [mine drainage metagenome]|uniref:Uncharacterized protein n=1 Tax=mine drainage metagenome TaxID=410659 RepID=A0A1J5P6D9_9ZZZZ
MATQGNIHFYVNWAKERLDEMEAVLTSLEGKAGEAQADARDRADKAITGLRKIRDIFRDTVKKQAEANEAAWATAKAQLEPEWNAFEADVRKYVENFNKQVEQQQATFKLQAEAQLKAWREAADKLGNDAKQFATERQAEIDVAVKRMQVDAGAAEEKLQKQLDQMGTQSWSALMTVLTETRSAFDRANQAARDAFK